ncbi:MAG: efflux RND transporter periplasmic adaptor subunit [Bacteroidota bacterium]
MLKYISILSLAILMVACAEQAPKTLAEKKAALEKKKTELVKLNQEINDLQAQIETEDPEAKNKVKRIPVGTTTLREVKFDHFVNVQGTVEAKNMVNVSPQSSGRITRIYVRKGQSVRRGQLLAQLDTSIMASSLAEIRTQLDLANIMFEKQERLWEQEIGTEVQYLTAKSQVESLERRIATLREQMSLSRVTSPISGTVEEVMPKEGEVAMPGMPAFRIVNPTDLSLVANLAESYVPFVRRGDLVKVNFPNMGKNYDAKVTVVGQSIDPLARTFSIEVKLPNDPILKANMFGEISINDRTEEEAIVVPQNLIQKSEVGQFVFVASESEGQWKAVRKTIETGLSYDGEVIIENGLAAGDKLITTGFKGLSDGQIIELNASVAAN